jgi:hypothetical protein
MSPAVFVVEGIYEKGVKVLAQELECYLRFWKRSEVLPKWDVIISPT